MNAPLKLAVVATSAAGLAIGRWLYVNREDLFGKARASIAVLAGTPQADKSHDGGVDIREMERLAFLAGLGDEQALRDLLAIVSEDVAADGEVAQAPIREDVARSAGVAYDDGYALLAARSGMDERELTELVLLGHWMAGHEIPDGPEAR